MYKVQHEETDTFLDSISPHEEKEDELLYYMQDAIDTIKNLDIKNFNYIVFEEDLDNMYKTEFNNFFNKYVIDLINYFNKYLAIELTDVQEEPYRVKLRFVKNIVRFIMNTLPYIYMKGYLENQNIEGLHDALDSFNDDLRDNLISQITKSQNQYKTFSNLMEDIEDTITNEKKKTKFNGMLTILDSSMENKKLLLDYYKSIIQNSGHDGLKELCTLYVKNDLYNII